MKIKLGVNRHLKELYNGFGIGMFLPIYAMYYKSLHASTCILTEAHSVINVHKKVNTVSKCLEKCAKYDDRENLAILCCKMPGRTKRARMRVCAFFCEMLKMT